MNCCQHRLLFSVLLAKNISVLMTCSALDHFQIDHSSVHSQHASVCVHQLHIVAQFYEMSMPTLDQETNKLALIQMNNSIVLQCVGIVISNHYLHLNIINTTFEDTT